MIELHIICVRTVNVKDVAKATREDRVYGKLLAAVCLGDINKNDSDLKQINEELMKVRQVIL